MKQARSSEANRKSDSDSQIIDTLDAFYAHELLGKLPKIVSRASALEELDLPRVPDNVRRYFEEAHHCFLYGFGIACAVLRRVILESALRELIDPDGSDRRAHQASLT